MASIPEKFRDLLTEKKAFAHLVTLQPDGSPQVTPVWIDAKGDTVLVNTARGRVKDRNMSANPAVAMCIADPDNPYRYVQIRGKVKRAREEGAAEHIDVMAKKYLGKDKYPFAQPGETRVIYEIERLGAGERLRRVGRMEGALDRAARGEPLSDEAAVHLAAAGPAALPAMLAAAAAARDRSFGRRVTFSPKVFLPLTNLCRNRCDYCSFRRSPGDGGEWTMTPAELEDWIGRAAEQGCGEALFCLGDKPEKAFGTYRRTLASFGHAGTVDYLVQGAELALRHGLLPHTNAGLLTHDDLRRLRRVNVSLGLMLECSSPRLCEPGMPHHRAPDKRPDRRLAMIADAGALKIPFTTGILIGIGETRQERAESLLAIRRLHRAHGHVQEVIVQSFRAVAGTPMAQSAEPDPAELLHAVALARLVLDPEVSLQAPPNLSPAGIAPLLGAGLNDFGGISPVTPDYINPRHPWPHLDALGETCAREGFELRPRMPVYDAYLGRAGWVEDELRPAARAVQARLGAVTQPSELARATKRAPLAHPRGARELAP